MKVDSLNAAISGYQLLKPKPIGHGSSGEVWLAVEPLSGRLVAVKILHRACSHEQVRVRELEGIQQLKHVSAGSSEIVQILKVDRVDDRYYYSMELADDARTNRQLESSTDDTSIYEPHTLKHVIEREAPLDPDRALDIIIQVLYGLDRLHTAGLIHRDIKPANILFINGRPKLGDLGLVTPSNRDVTQIGTPDYMPPGGRVDETSDIYAAGIVLYEMITGLRVQEYPTLPNIKFGCREKVKAFQIANKAATRAASPLSGERFQSARDMLDFILKARLPSARIGRRAMIGLCCLMGLIALVGGAYSIQSKPDRTTVAILSTQGLDELAFGRRALRVQFDDGATQVIRFPTTFYAPVSGKLWNGKDALAIGFDSVGPDAGTLQVFDSMECRHSNSPKPIYRRRFCNPPPAKWDFQDHPGVCHVTALLATELDGRPGDELVISSRHDNGPSELIILSLPDTILGRFWHYGWITHVIAEDLDGDGTMELICGGIANWRESPMPPGRRPEPLHACMFVLGLESIHEKTGYWGANEWLHDGSTVSPLAYGYVLPRITNAKDDWYLGSIAVFNGTNGLTIRASVNTDLLIDFDADLKPKWTGYISGSGHEDDTPPLADDLWVRTWPPADSTQDFRPNQTTAAQDIDPHGRVPILVGATKIVKATRPSGPSNTGRELQVGFSDDTSRVIQFSSPIGHATFGNLMNGKSALAVGFDASGPDAGILKIFDASECERSENPRPLLESRFCHSPPAAWDFQEHPEICHLSALASTDLDGEPGDELILASRHDDGSCEIIVFKPPDTILGSFWHYGWIQQVAVDDVDGDGAKELICSGVANWRESATRTGKYPEPLHACILVLSMETLKQRNGYWGSPEWLHEDSPAAPIAYGYCLKSVLPDRIWEIWAMDILKGTLGARIRASFVPGLYVEFNSGLAGIKAGYNQLHDDRNATPPPVNEIWKRAWPINP